MTKQLIIPGGSGFLGTSFRRFAESRGFQCKVLTRHPRESHDVYWDGRSVGEWKWCLEGADGVVNFTGRSVNCLYNERNRREIIESRIDSVRAIDETVLAMDPSVRPPVIVQAASLAIFGDTTLDCDENGPHGEGFSVDVCEAWEAEFFWREIPSVRKCLLRIGFALGPGGGALEPLRKLTRFYLGGTVGSGRQFISWLHVEDLNRMFIRCFEDASLSGVFNATGPTAVSNRTFMKAMRGAMGRPWSPPAPTLLVKLGARFLLKTEASLALTGRKGVPRRFLESGFVFKYTELDKTLHEILARWDDDLG